MKSLIVGNWKLYINSVADGKKLLKEIDKRYPRGVKAEVVVCPQLSIAAALRAGYGGKRIAFGTQDVFYEDGAHTGSVSPKSLATSGIRFVLVGHIERRILGDTDEMVAKKAAAAIEAKLHPIICVGEPARDQEGGHFTYLATNVTASLGRLSGKDAARFTVAYDPVWAIGQEEAPSPAIIAQTVMFIRKTIADMWGREAADKVRIIYGGSVDAESAKGFRDAGIQGLLPGRASVDAAEFAGIIKAFS